MDKGTKPAIALKKDGTPLIAYMEEDQSGFVKVAARDESGWQVTTVAKGYFYGPLDIAIGPDDVPQIAYHDHQDSTFKQDKGDAALAVFDGETWSIESIFDAGHDGWDTRITVDRDGKPHISGIDPEEFGGQGVEYYSKDDAGEWTVEQLGSGSLTYKYATSVAVGLDGTPYVTYFDQENDDLILASRDDSGWVLSTVDGDGDTGLFAQLVIDGDGRFHISYFQRESSTSGTVKYATKGADESEWEIREVDGLSNLMFGFVGARNITSVAVDGVGNPWIAYTDEKDLKLAVWNESGWEISQVVEADGQPLGQLVSLKLDSNDEPHIAYFVVTSGSPLKGQVMYATGTRS